MEKNTGSMQVIPGGCFRFCIESVASGTTMLLPHRYAASPRWGSSLNLACLMRKVKSSESFVLMWVSELIACDQWSSVA